MSAPPHWLNNAYDMCKSCVPGELTSEIVAVEDACSRVAGEDVRVPNAVPRVPYSTCRGYAMRAADTAGATPSRPVELALESGLAGYFAGGGDPAARALPPGACQMVLAGIALPENADAVLSCIDEMTDEVTLPLRLTERVTYELRQHANVHTPGADYVRGAVLVARGTRITAQLQAVLIAAGVLTLPVFKRPRIGVVLCSYDSVRAQDAIHPWQRADATGIYVRSVLARWGYAVPPVEQVTPRGANESPRRDAEVRATYVRRLIELMSRYDLLIGVGMPADSRFHRCGLGGAFTFPAGRLHIALDKKGACCCTLALSDDRSPPVRRKRPIYRQGSTSQIAGWEGFAYIDRAVVLDLAGYTPEVAGTTHITVRRILDLMEGVTDAGPTWRKGVLAKPITRRPDANRLLWGVARVDEGGRVTIEVDDAQHGLSLRAFSTANALVAIQFGVGLVAAGESVDYVLAA